MKVVVVTGHEFRRDSSGRIHSSNGTEDYAFWTRYLDVFDSVLVVARVRAAGEPAEALAEGPGVEVYPLPGWRGAREYLTKRGAIHSRLDAVGQFECAYLFRVPSSAANVAWSRLCKSDRPYGLEVKGELQAMGSFSELVRHPLREYLRRWRRPRLLQCQCANATAVAYVTAKSIQENYPPSTGAFVTHYSSIDIGDESFVQAPRQFSEGLDPVKVIGVGRLPDRAKGFDVLVDAVKFCVDSGLDVRATIVGGGRQLPALRERAAGYGLAGRLEFTGEVPPGEPVRRHLDRSHVFVLPSRGEGLPRAVIEAMARGLPCVATDVGGISELLPAEDLVPSDEATALAAKIREVGTDAARMRRMSERNLRKAREYHRDVLRGRRNQMYAHLREATERWLARSTR